VNLQAELKERVLAAARREPAPTRPQVVARARRLSASALAVALLLFFAVGGVRAAPRPIPLVAATALGWAAVAAAALWVAFARRRSMLGPPRSALWALVAGTPTVLFGWMLLWSTRLAAQPAIWSSRIGLRCFGLTLLLAAWPLAALILARRQSDPIHPEATGAALGAAVGAAVGAFTDLWCPIAAPSHVAFGHISPILLLAVVGMIAGRVVIAIRR
jgi:hypothetical protein